MASLHHRNACLIVQLFTAVADRAAVPPHCLGHGGKPPLNFRPLFKKPFSFREFHLLTLTAGSAMYPAPQ